MLLGLIKGLVSHVDQPVSIVRGVGFKGGDPDTTKNLVTVLGVLVDM